MSRFFKRVKIEDKFYMQDCEAKKYFASNQKASIYLENAKITYLKTQQGILRLTNTINCGAFGIIRIAQPLNGDLKRLVKVQKVADPETFESIQAEVEVNHAMGIASAELVLSHSIDLSNKLFNPVTCYQQMRYLGKNLTQIEIKENPLDIAIQLLLKVDNLHKGKLALNGIPYAHRDIKAENILIDNFNNVHLIDFGNASSDINGIVHKATEIVGSRGYLPIDKASWDKLDNPKSSELFQHMHQNTTFLFHDKIATLRVIYNPLNEYKDRSLLNDEHFEALPSHIKILFDTAEIAPMLTDERKQETEKFLAAVLIAYSDNPDITVEEVSHLKMDIKKQNKICNYYLRFKIIQQTDVSQAKKMVYDFKGLLANYNAYLVKQYSLKESFASSKYPLAWEKHQLLQAMFKNIDKEVNPSKQLKVLYKDFITNKYTLSQIQSSEDFSYWEKIKNFFADLFANQKGKSITQTIDKGLAKAVVSLHYKNSLAVMKQEPDSDFTFQN